MNILVIGGTRKVGRPLVQALVRRGANVRVLMRTVDRSALVDAPATAVGGDILGNPEGVRELLAQADAVSQTVSGQIDAIGIVDDAEGRHFRRCQGSQVPLLSTREIMRRPLLPAASRRRFRSMIRNRRHSRTYMVLPQKIARRAERQARRGRRASWCRGGAFAGGLFARAIRGEVS